jgi:hypothetical protein
MRQNRPNPDEFLARIKSEEQQQSEGKLTIFLGFAAGVGKTYAMLEAAQQQKMKRAWLLPIKNTWKGGKREAFRRLEILRKQVVRGILVPRWI